MFRVASISVAVSLSVLSMAAGSASPARDRFIVFSESIGGVRLNMPEAAGSARVSVYLTGSSDGVGTIAA